MSMPFSARFAALTAVTIVASQAVAEPWTVTNLHPDGARQSRALAASGSVQAGSATFSGNSRAGSWTGSAESWDPINNPFASISSETLGIYVDEGVGFLQALEGANQAMRYDDGGVTSLHPDGATQSVASGVSADQQSGYAVFGGVSHAGLWRGTAGSWVDLHPAGAMHSVAEATNGTKQAGYVEIAERLHASLWSGTRESWVDLSPAGSTGSVVYGISGSQQVGYAVIDGVTCAGLWQETRESWINLAPDLATFSFAHATNGTQQVGYVVLEGQTRASWWNGIASSWVDLSEFVPDEFSDSYARGISTDGINTYISGFGYNTRTNRYEALLWTQPVPAPGVAAILGLGGLVAARRQRGMGR